MTYILLQAGKRIALSMGVLAILGVQGVAAGTALERKQELPGKSEDVISFGDLWDSASDLLPSFSSSDRQNYKNAAPESLKSVTKAAPAEAKQSEPKTIEAKRIEEKPIEAKQLDKAAEKPPAPYKVYPSPYVPDEMSVSQPMSPAMDPMQEMAAQMAAQVPAQASPQAPQLVGPQDVKPMGPPPLTGPATVPVTGMSRQLFPIFPLNAPPDMPPQMLPVAVNRNLETDQSMISRAIIAVHDLSRNASESLTTITTLAGAENENTLIIAPQFPLEIDIARFMPYLPDKGQAIARWPVSRNSGWQTGEDSIAKPPFKGISSFTALDLLLLMLADRDRFPALQQVVLVGHGVGGDFVQRYAAVGQAPDILAKQGLPVRFLAANASSYLYLTSVRPSPVAANFTMADTTQCPNVTHYPYGLANLVPYARRSGPEAIRLRYTERRVMYLLSENIVNDPYLDNDCAAMAQGKDRLSRGRNYERYLRVSFGEAAERSQSFTLVPQAGYDPVALLGSYCGMAMLFGDGTCATSMIGKESVENKPKLGNY